MEVRGQTQEQHPVNFHNKTHFVSLDNNISFTVHSSTGESQKKTHQWNQDVTVFLRQHFEFFFSFSRLDMKWVLNCTYDGFKKGL